MALRAGTTLTPVLDIGSMDFTAFFTVSGLSPVAWTVEWHPGGSTERISKCNYRAECAPSRGCNALPYWYVELRCPGNRVMGVPIAGFKLPPARSKSTRASAPHVSAIDVLARSLALATILFTGAAALANVSIPTAGVAPVPGFVWPVVLPSAMQCTTTADMNRDGLADVICDRVVYIAMGTAPWFTAVAVPSSGPWLSAVTADVNGDGWPDVVARLSAYLYNWYQSAGTSPVSFTEHEVSAFGGIQTAATLSWAAADADGDGLADVVVALSTGTCLWAHSSGGSSTPSFVYGTLLNTNSPSDTFVAMTWADMNSDGRVDLVGTSSPHKSIVCFLSVSGSAQAAYATPSIVLVNLSAVGVPLAALIVVDGDGDGYNDMFASYTGSVLSGLSSTVWWFRSNGVSSPMTFTSTSLASWSPATIYCFKALTVGDVDGNGFLDVAIVTASQGTASSSYGRPAQWLLVNPYTSTTTVSIPPAVSGVSTSWMVAGDFDGDGLGDSALSYSVSAVSSSALMLNVLCLAGQYSSTGTRPCQPCNAGFACVAGTMVATPADRICPSGQFSVAGAVSCTPCRCAVTVACSSRCLHTVPILVLIIPGLVRE